MNELDKIYDKIDGLMEAGKLEDLDRMFVGVNLKETDLDLLLGLLTASLSVKSKLPSRPAFFKAVAERCIELGETDPKILQGLE